MSPWGWMPKRDRGIWRHGSIWTRPAAQIAPYASVMLCMALMYVVGRTMTVSNGVLFDLPESEIRKTGPATLAVMAMPVKNDTAIFFDDVRYVLDDGVSSIALGEHLSDRLSKSTDKTLLLFADRRIQFGDLVKFVGIARKSGSDKVLFASRREGNRTE